ncbi:MAG: hypothetical protein V3V08_03555 [Nannocystaceae bacterium]
MSTGYGTQQRDLRRAAALSVWILASDALLKVVARIAACGTSVPHTSRLLRSVWLPADACGEQDRTTETIQLVFVQTDAAIFGLAAPVVVGQVGMAYGATLLALAALLTSLVLRWKWRTPADAHALAAVWAGALITGIPRLVSEGRGLGEISIYGTATGLGDLALVWGLLWLIVRWLAERRG